MAEKIIITIGREFGSGGHDIGEALAKKLGIAFYDKNLLAEAAKESGLCEELFNSQDEKPTNSFLYSLVMDTYPEISEFLAYFGWNIGYFALLLAVMHLRSDEVKHYFHPIILKIYKYTRY